MKTAVMFSGAAGTSLGARDAGAEIVWAANHNAACVAVHAANFPECDNVQQDLHLFNHAAIPVHDMLLASPVCRASSTASQPARARGIKLQSAHNAMRTLAWSVVDALEVNRPRFVVVENVPEFAKWDLYDIWKRALRRLGYRLSEQVLTATAWGVPQERSRLFVVGTLGRKVIRVKDPRGVEPPPMHALIDWGGDGWLPFDAACGPRFREQLDKAARVLGDRPGFVNLVQGRPVYPSTEPLRTMTCQDQYRWVYRGGFRYPVASEAFALMGFPPDYILPEMGRTVAWSMAGDAVCPPVMRGIVDRVIGSE